MAGEKIKITEEKADRRLRARGRLDYRERRVDFRYASNFPVNIHVGEGENGRVYHAIARDISDGGLFLENVDIPETEKRFRLDFKIPESTMPEEYIQGEYHIEGKPLRYDSQKRQTGVAFQERLSTRLARSTWKFFSWIALLGLFITVSFVLLIKIENVYFFWFDVPIFLYSLTVGSYLMSRFLFASFYRPPRRQESLPAVTVVVPAYNEEAIIEKTLTHVMEVSYPAEKLQVIVVNDGSSDATLGAIQRVRARYPELVIVDFSENRGKRRALAAGALMGMGDITVFIDSDTLIEPEAIRNIVDGFADPEVAAVCGHCEVANPWTNLLTRMQAVRYFIGFRVLKAAESIFDSVTCLSGPLAAYRTTNLKKVLDDWVGQTFLGRPATFGDDRSLTNFLLKHHKVVYDARARTATVVPEKYKQFFKQQMRWKRSWFRESIRAAAFLWRKQPLMSISFYLGFILPLLGPAIVLRAMVYVPLFRNGSPLTYMFGIFLMSTLMSTTYLLAKRSRLWLYGTTFCFFYMFVLIWQLPWAILTFWKTGWGSRGEGV